MMFPAAELWAPYASTFFGAAGMMLVLGAVHWTRATRVSRWTRRCVKVVSFATLGAVWGLAAGLAVDVYCFLAGFEWAGRLSQIGAWAGFAAALFFLVASHEQTRREG